jgi:hypothetical protein
MALPEQGSRSSGPVGHPPAGWHAGPPREPARGSGSGHAADRYGEGRRRVGRRSYRDPVACRTPAVPGRARAAMAPTARPELIQRPGGTDRDTSSNRDHRPRAPRPGTAQRPGRHRVLHRPGPAPGSSPATGLSQPAPYRCPAWAVIRPVVGAGRAPRSAGRGGGTNRHRSGDHDRPAAAATAVTEPTPAERAGERRSAGSLDGRGGDPGRCRAAPAAPDGARSYG